MADEVLPLELRLGLRTGSVFYFQSRELFSEEPHFFIVVNREPLARKLLLLTIVSSQLDKVRLRRRQQLQTVVEISPAEYTDFTKVSVIDCNVVIEKPLSDLAGMLTRKEVRFHRDLPISLLEKIKTAIEASPLITAEIKNLL